MSQVSVFLKGTGAAPIESLTGDSGAPVVPDSSGNIDILGGANIVTTGTANTVTIDLNGTTDNAVQVGNASGSLSSLTVGSDGQLLIGATGADPAFATVTSTGSTIVFSAGANTLNFEAEDAIPNSFSTDSGSAVPSSHALTVAGGNNIGTSGAGSTVTVNLNGTTDNAVQVGNASGSLSSLALGTNGQVLLGSTGADPAFGTLTSGDSSITFTPGAASLALAVTQASTTQLGGAELATDAEVETGTDTARVPSVSSMIGHEGIAKAWVKHAMDGTFADAFNVSSVTDTGTGQATVNFTTNFADTNYCVVVTPQDGATGITAMADTQTVSSVLVEYRNANTTLSLGNLQDPTNGMVICIGDR